MSAHTKGPWFVVDSVNGNWPRGCELAIDDAEGGNPERDYFLASAVHGDPDELIANARLIASAPELLTALERILYAHDNHGNGAAMGEAQLCPQYASMARAAIEKATGEQS